jgi:MraZ protein
LAFRGQYEHSLDSKDRLTVPARFRAAFADGLVLLEGLDASVDVYPTGAYERMTDRYLSGESPMAARGRKIQRRFHGKARDETIDSAGRIRLPRHMIEHAGLEGTCVVVGANDHLEVWDPQSWEAELAEVDAEIERISQEQPAGED